MLIGEAGQRSGLSARTIRFYEAQRVISPATRTASGYRTYQDRVLEELQFVRRSQQLGFSLADVRELLEVGRVGQLPCAQVVSVCDRHLAEIDSRLRELRTMRAELRTTRALAHGRCGLTSSGFCSAVMSGGPTRRRTRPVRP